MEKDNIILIYVLILIIGIAIAAYLFIGPHGSDFNVDSAFIVKNIK